MSFLQKYYIVSLLAEGETKLFRAQEITTGRPVLLHQLLRERTAPGQPDLASMVFKYIPGTGAPGSEHFVDMGQDDGRVFIVTADVPACHDLRQWLRSIEGVQEAETPSAMPPTGRGTTQMFPGLKADNLSPPVADLNAARSHDSHSQQPPAGAGAPDEVTRMFHAESGQQNPPAAQSGLEIKPSPEVKPAEKRARGQVPSGFEVVFQSRKRTTKVDLPESSTPTVLFAAQQPPAAAAPDEFAQLFSGLGEASAEPPHAPSAVAPSMPPSAVSPARVENTIPGESTRQLLGLGSGTPDHPPLLRPTTLSQPPTAAAPTGNTGSGEFTRQFLAAEKGAPNQPNPLSLPETKKLPTTPSSGRKGGPGEFTRMFSGIGKGNADQPAPPSLPSAGTGNPAAPQPSAGKKGPGEFTRMFSVPSAATEPREATPAEGRKPSAPPSDAPAQKPPGEFTGLFLSDDQSSPKTVLSPTGRQTIPPEGARLQEPPAFPAASGDSRGPGEFTQRFKSGAEPVAGSRPPGPGSSPPSGVPLSSSSKKGPGEFTQLLQGYKPTAPAAPALEDPKPVSPPPTAGKKAPGEFTLLFQRPPQPAAPAPPAAPPPSAVQAAPPPPQPRQAGEYTSIFEAPRMPAAPPQTVSPASPTSGPGYPAFPLPPPPAAPQMAYPQAASAQAPQYQPPPPPSYAVAPPPMPQYQPPAPSPQAVPVGTKKPGSFLTLLLVLGGLFVVAVALILFFALRH